MFKRARYQFGWLELRERKKGSAVWLWRYRGNGSESKREKESVLEEFLLGKTLRLKHELAEVGESNGGLGLDESQRGGGEEGGEGGAEIAGGEDVAAEEFVDLLAGFLGVEVVAVFLGVEITEVHVVGGWGHLTAAAVGEDKHARAGAILVDGHGGSPERLNFRLSGKPAQERSRAHFSMGEVWQLGMELSSRMLVMGCGEAPDGF